MEFVPLEFDAMNEADVREEVVAPLLRALGYRSGTAHNVIREQSLRYPYQSLGRKDARKDPPLRGRADYICEVDALIRWAIEAKAPNVQLDHDVIEQAYTYAAHPEVRAVYFCLTNGRELHFYQTHHGPGVPPVFSVPYPELAAQLTTVQNLVGPAALRRDYPRQVPDVGEPIGPGLRSVVRVSNGYVEFRSSNLNAPMLTELTLEIFDGAVERDDDRRLHAYLRTRSPFRSVNELNAKLGLNEMELSSPDAVLSSDPGKPTIFSDTSSAVFPAGLEMPNPATGQKIRIPQSIGCTVTVEARGALNGHRFAGEFSASYQFSGLPQRLDTRGRFEVFLT